MSKSRFRNPGLAILGVLLLAPFSLYGAVAGSGLYVIAGLIMVIYTTLLFLNFEVGFMALLFIRTSLDYAKNFGDMNLAALASIAIIVLGVFYVLYRRANPLQLEDSKPFLLFIVLCGLSMFRSPNMVGSFSDWLRLLSVFAAYVLTRLLFTTEDKIKNAFTVILLSALLPILLAYYQLVTGHGTIHDAGQDRIVGTFLHPNAFGSYLLIILIFSVVQVLEGFPMGHKSFLGGFTFLAFVIFVFTLSRGAWIVFVLSMLLLGKLRYRKLLGLIPPLVLVAVLGVPAVRNRIMDLVEPNSQYAAGRSAWEWRLNTWEEIGPLVKEEPLIGHGLAMIETEFGILTHNDYLRLLAETGIIGCAGYLILAFSTLRRSWRDYKQSRTRLGLSLQLSTVAMISGFLVRQFADNSLRNTVVMIYFWVLIALARNMNILDQASSEDDNPPPPEEEPEPEIVPDPTGEAEPEPEPVLEGTL